MNHCFSLQDVSSMRDAIKKHLGWDDTRSESEAEVGMLSQFSEADKFRVPKEQLSCLSAVAASNGHNIFLQTGELQSNVREENRRLKDELMNMESAKKDLEGRLHSASNKSEALMNQLQESEKTIASLQTELDILKESNGMIEDQIKNHKVMNEDLDTQLTVARVELNEAHQRLSSLEVELENKNNCCEELEGTCLELQLQLESLMKKEILSCDMDREEKQLRTDWEITAASEKLAECQETILNLGKQLKALASPREAALFDKVISAPSDTTTTTPKKNMSQRSSLLDRMLAEDDAETKDPKSPTTKEIICSSNLQKPPSFLDGNSNSAFSPDPAVEPPEKFLASNKMNQHDDEAAIGSLAIVPSKKRGGVGLLRKLLWRRKKGNSKKKTPPPLPLKQI
ncbi:hypothetical protein L1049_024427 [Liquidambar formosana]|uniref:Filament-like plant protein 7 n=1 Tax=Liquidambar formosana TaxID=63359 RepID=A0AAP0RVS8_LIQFO